MRTDASYAGANTLVVVSMRRWPVLTHTLVRDGMQVQHSLFCHLLILFELHLAQQFHLNNLVQAFAFRSRYFHSVFLHPG